MSIQPFVIVGLHIQEKMEMTNPRDKGIAMKFAKLYSPNKIALIVQEAQSYTWWRNNPGVAFMKAVGVVNKKEKENAK